MAKPVKSKRRSRNKAVQKITLSELTSEHFSEATFEVFLANYSGHVTTDAACKAAGTTRWSLYRWLRKNPERVDELKRAIEVPILTQIRDAIAHDWRAGGWILERTFPERYALQNVIRHTGGVNVTLVDKVSEEEAIRFASDIRDMEASIVAMPKLLNGSHP